MAIDPLFDQRPLTDHDHEVVRNFSIEASEMLRQIQTKVPDGRYQALAITTLEQCVMWANKGITHGGGW